MLRGWRKQLRNARIVVCDIETDVTGAQESAVRNDLVE